MDDYCFLHLRGTGNNAEAAREALAKVVVPAWESCAISCWGVFGGLFGVASNELLVVAASPEPRALDDYTAALGGKLEVRKAERFEPTVRPTRIEARERPGIYVFRFFRVSEASVAEFVELSDGAWVTFEGADDYAAEPQGLFRQAVAGPGGDLDMLLVTWYENLAAWQTSRNPDPEAAGRFQRRRALTRHTVAFATTLLAG